MARRTPIVKLNKGAVLTGSGLVIVTGVGISKLSSAGYLPSIASKEYIDLRTSLKDASPNTLNEELIIPIDYKNEDQIEINVQDNESNIRTPKLQQSNNVVAQDQNVVTDSTSEISFSNYTIDSGYLNSLGSTSMGWKFKDHVILAPKNSKVGNQKAEQLKQKAKSRNGRTNGLFVVKDKLYNAGNREMIDMSNINGEKIHSLCTSILSHNDHGLGFTYIGRLNQKGFFDFVWESCGRWDKSKPSNWKFAQ